MSVVGRAVDRPGLDDLIEQVSQSVGPISEATGASRSSDAVGLDAVEHRVRGGPVRAADLDPQQPVPRDLDDPLDGDATGAAGVDDGDRGVPVDGVVDRLVGGAHSGCCGTWWGSAVPGRIPRKTPWPVASGGRSSRGTCRPTAPGTRLGAASSAGSSPSVATARSQPTGTVTERFPERRSGWRPPPVRCSAT